jgi:hypothetical protein
MPNNDAPPLVTDSQIQHSALECGSRYCAQHRDIWWHYENHIRAAPPVAEGPASGAAPSGVSQAEANAKVNADYDRVVEEISGVSRQLGPPSCNCDCHAMGAGYLCGPCCPDRKPTAVSTEPPRPAPVRPKGFRMTRNRRNEVGEAN